MSARDEGTDEPPLVPRLEIAIRVARCPVAGGQLVGLEQLVEAEEPHQLLDRPELAVHPFALDDQPRDAATFLSV